MNRGLIRGNVDSSMQSPLMLERVSVQSITVYLILTFRMYLFEYAVPRGERGLHALSELGVCIAFDSGQLELGDGPKGNFLNDRAATGI